MMPMMMNKRGNQNQQGQPPMMQPGQQPPGPNPYIFMNSNYQGKNKKGGYNNRAYINNQQGGKNNRGGANQRGGY